MNARTCSRVVVGMLLNLVACLCCCRAWADPVRLTLEQAMLRAVEHHPSLDRAAALERVAEASVESARIDILPQIGVSVQVSRATDNVVPGASFAISGIPSLSGPPTGRIFDGGAWGSTLALWTAWDVTGLLRRMAVIDVRLAEQRQSRASTELQRLQVAFDAAEAFVAVAQARAIVRSVRASVERVETFSRIVSILSANHLRASGDLARIELEIALARTQLVRAEQSERITLYRLAETVGSPGELVDVVTDGLDDVSAATPSVHSRHPRLLEADAAVEAAQIRQRVTGLEYLPRLDLVGALWLRGSGYFPGGANLGVAQGLLPDTPNWAVGVVLSWPIMELFAVRARSRAAEASTRVQEAQRHEIEATLAVQVDTARAVLVGAQEVSAQSKLALAAASVVEQQTQARYRAGLATVLEVADAQRLLTQADAEDVIARLSVRRARLIVARATGDLTPFVLESVGTLQEGH